MAKDKVIKGGLEAVSSLFKGLPDSNIKRLKEWYGIRPVAEHADTVTIYRAIPDGSSQAAILPGDWVSMNKDYVTNYAGPKARVLSTQVPANELVDLQTGEVPGDTLVWALKHPFK